jgi:molybdopterin synthase sulfur carrier subunit
MDVTVRYYAGARAAAGTQEERLQLDGVADLNALIQALIERHGPDLARVLAASSYLLDEVAGSRDRPLRDGVRVDVLPPFAGG